VPDYGFFLNDLLAGFDTVVSTGKEIPSAEAMTGGQRPRGSEAPVFFFKDGKPAILANAYGVADPAAILLNAITPRIDLGASCTEAVGLPRLWVRGESLLLEKGLYEQETIRLKLELLGHKLKKEDPLGFVQMVCFDPGSGKIEGESDPRTTGEAAGF
jgi:gamma-glutamyltranspeptidase